MNKLLWLSGLAILLAGCCGSPYPNKPGNLFLRQKTSNLEAWKTVFKVQREELRNNGFLAFSLHQDLTDHDTVLISLKCSNLKKAVRFIHSSAFRSPQEKSSAIGKPEIWAGVDVTERQYDGKLEKAPAGIVIVHHQVKDFNFWLECFTHSNAGKHSHPNRGYVPSNRSIHRMPGKPEAALVVHEASDVSKAPAFMTDPNMKGRMEASGVIGTPDIWYGINLEEGIF